MDCFNCELYEENLTEEIVNVLHNKYGWPKTEIACKGCRKQDGRHIHIPNGCATLECVNTKKVAMCCDCPDFPCTFLAPVADLAALRPHNTKLYNLCRIRKVGMDRWIEKEADQVRKKYFSYTFEVGRGQGE